MEQELVRASTPHRPLERAGDIQPALLPHAKSQITGRRREPKAIPAEGRVASLKPMGWLLVWQTHT
jgi:hypothetical protein